MKKFILVLFLLILNGCFTYNMDAKDIAPINGNTNTIDKAVYVNQAGYLHGKEKYFITNIDSSTFYVFDKKGKEVFKGEVSLRIENDPSTGLNLYYGDFSLLETFGEYYIKLDTDHVSHSFTISSTIYDDVARKSLKSFYFQRCGVPLVKEYAGDFYRNSCHEDDGIFHESVDGEYREMQSVGGWHDAGDYGKYVHSASTAIGIMTIMYEQFSDNFLIDDNTIPESGNNIPDFLDEIKVELDWMLTMQNTKTGDKFEGACHYMINTMKYAPGMPEMDPYTRYIYNYSSVATANFAAVMAQASRIYKSINEAASKEYKEAAEKAWAFLEANPQIYPENGFKRPVDTLCGGYCEYADENDVDDRLWASVELYITTGDQKYHDAAINRYGLNSSSFSGISWESSYDFPRMQYLLTNRETNSDIKGVLTRALDEFNKQTIKRIEMDGFMDSMDTYYWGGNGALLLHAQYLILGIKLNPDMKDKYEKNALRLLNYLLGVNPHNMSFVTKVGTIYPKNIHHAALAADNVNDIYPGVVTGGPNQYSDDFLSGTPPGLCYTDDFDSYSSNENCILYNAPLVSMAFYFSKLGSELND